MPHVLQRTLDRSLPALIQLASEAQAFLAGAGVREPALFKVQLALEETIRNLIEHAGASRTGRFQVRIEVGSGRVTIVLEDDGQPFDPDSAPPYDPSRPLAKREPHGMGLHLLRHFMQEIHYERLGGMNRLRMVVSSH
jgi:anti-sigma regulatory factor (Ser/Thr protein kinase)